MMRPTLFTMLNRIWRQSASSKPFETPPLSEKIATTVLVLATEISLRGLCARMGRLRVVATEIYQALVLVMLICLSRLTANHSVVVLSVLCYLVYEIVGWTIFDVFVEANTADLRGRRSAIRALLWAAYSYLVTTWAYGLYYWTSRDVTLGSSKEALPLSSLQDGIYFSVITITTTGYGDYTPRSGSVAQLVVMTEPFVGLILLSMYFAVLVSAVSESFRKSIET